MSGKSVKTTNSTNRERGSVLKTMDKIATCSEDTGNESTDSGGYLSMMLFNATTNVPTTANATVSEYATTQCNNSSRVCKTICKQWSAMLRSRKKS